MVQAKIADLIQKNSTLVCEFEIPLSIGDRAREAAAQVAEQFAFKQFRRNGRHVDGDEGPAGPGTQTMHRACEQFLSCSRFSCDENGQRRPRGFFEVAKFGEQVGVCGDNRELFTLLS